MSSKLLIVESPAKAKTIEKYLDNKFIVRSCYGHIRDLKKENMGIDIENNFKPQYEISDDKQKVVSELKKIAKNSEVWLATDEDREGEAISWHLCEVLGLDYHTTKRIVFHEITKKSIQEAVKKPRLLDTNLVDAQQARRVLDRIVGFKLSPLLQKKLNRYTTSLSAGRVQSVAVKLIVEREREINKFNSQNAFKIKAFFNGVNSNNKAITFFADGVELKTKEQVEGFLKTCIDAKYIVQSIDLKPGKRTPAAPFTTSTLQQEASRKLGYSVTRTMSVAQKLYENGYITYMRTDSVNLSDTARQDIQQQIFNMYGKNFFQQRKFQNKNESAQEAHEAIRPTDMTLTSLHDEDGAALYNLIWKRTIASQMADAITEKTKINILISTNKQHIVSTGEVIKFEGFLKVYLEDTDDDNEDKEENDILPAVKINDVLDFVKMDFTQKFTKAPARYNEASLVKKLEELGIGRPSTYAPTISTIQKRAYVEKKEHIGKEREYHILTLDAKNKITQKTAKEIVGADKNRLSPSDLGMIVTDYLSESFKDIMDYNFTATMEESFDKIAEGKLKWQTTIKNFYQPFIKLLDENLNNQQFIKRSIALGKDPKTKQEVIARLGKFGPIVQIGDSNSDNVKFASIPQHLSMETISLDQALQLFTLPRNIGQYKNKDVIINTGPYGPYLNYDGKFYSLGKNIDPYTITDKEAFDFIAVKSLLPRTLGQYKHQDVIANNGKFGAYVSWNGEFCSLKKDMDVYKITLEDAIPVIEAKLESNAKRTIVEFKNEDIVVMDSKFGIMIKHKGKTHKLPRSYKKSDIEQMDVSAIQALIQPKAKKTTTKIAASKAPKKTTLVKTKKVIKKAVKK